MEGETGGITTLATPADGRGGGVAAVNRDCGRETGELLYAGGVWEAGATVGGRPTSSGV